MNRERSPSVDGERRSRPRWDDPTGQLPGAGVPSGVDSGLYGTSRRRDSSVPDRTRLRSREIEGTVSSLGELNSTFSFQWYSGIFFTFFSSESNWSFSRSIFWDVFEWR